MSNIVKTKKIKKLEIEELTARKQKYETFLEINEPLVIEATKQFLHIRDNIGDPPHLTSTQKVNLHKYLSLMRKNPEIAQTKKMIIGIGHSVDRLNKEILSL